MITTTTTTEESSIIISPSSPSPLLKSLVSHQSFVVLSQVTLNRDLLFFRVKSSRLSHLQAWMRPSIHPDIHGRPCEQPVPDWGEDWPRLHRGRSSRYAIKILSLTHLLMLFLNELLDAILSGTDLSTGEEVAIKLEYLKGRHSLHLDLEARCYEAMTGKGKRSF